jgi:hypothetical protein
MMKRGPLFVLMDSVFQFCRVIILTVAVCFSCGGADDAVKNPGSQMENFMLWKPVAPETSGFLFGVGPYIIII